MVRNRGVMVCYASSWSRLRGDAVAHQNDGPRRTVLRDERPCLLIALGPRTDMFGAPSAFGDRNFTSIRGGTAKP